MIGGLLESVAAFAALWGTAWFLMDHNAEAPCWLLAFAGVCLITGMVIA